MKKPLNSIIFYIISIVFLYCIYDSFQHIRAEVYHRNGYIKKERGYPKLANKDFKKATKLTTWETHYQLQLAKSYEDTAKKHPKQKSKYTSLAIREYQSLIERDPINPWFQARLGLIFHDLYKKDKTDLKSKELAYIYAKKATDNDPKNPLFTLHFGHLMFSYKDYKKAKEYYDLTISYDYDITEAHFNLAAIYNIEENKNMSIEHYKAVSEQLTKMEKKSRKVKVPGAKSKIETFQNARIKLAKHYLETQNLNEARQLIEKIPVSVERYELLAEYFTKVNQPKTAISLYKQLNDRLKTSKYDKQINALNQ